MLGQRPKEYSNSFKCSLTTYTLEF